MAKTMINNVRQEILKYAFQKTSIIRNYKGFLELQKYLSESQKPPISQRQSFTSMFIVPLLIGFFNPPETIQAHCMKPLLLFHFAFQDST